MPKSNPTPDTTHQDVKNQILNAMHSCDADSDEFATLLQRYESICAIDAANRRENKWLSPLIPAVGNILGIVTMGVFETKGQAIFTSKAVNLFGNKLGK